MGTTITPIGKIGNFDPDAYRWSFKCRKRCSPGEERCELRRTRGITWAELMAQCPIDRQKAETQARAQKEVMRRKREQHRRDSAMEYRASRDHAVAKSERKEK